MEQTGTERNLDKVLYKLPPTEAKHGPQNLKENCEMLRYMEWFITHYKSTRFQTVVLPLGRGLSWVVVDDTYHEGLSIKRQADWDNRTPLCPAQGLVVLPVELLTVIDPQTRAFKSHSMLILVFERYVLWFDPLPEHLPGARQGFDAWRKGCRLQDREVLEVYGTQSRTDTFCTAWVLWYWSLFYLNHPAPLSNMRAQDPDFGTRIRQFCTFATNV